jgi:hypothetical protein
LAAPNSVKRRAFLVDFQTRTHPAFIEALRRVHDGGLGDLLFGEALCRAESPWEQYYDLGRKSAYENRIVTWEDLLKDGERLVPDLKGLKD